MTAIYGCVVCGMERPKELDYNWLTTHRRLTCPTARWGRLDD